MHPGHRWAVERRALLGETTVAKPEGRIVFVLHSHLPWVLGHGRWPHGEDWLHEASAECYLPILRTVDRLAFEGRSAKLTIGITPVLAEMLASPRFKEGLLAYLEDRRALAERNSDDFRAGGDHDAERLAASWVAFYDDARRDFLESYHGNLLAAFRRLQDEGHIELITSAATHGYLPLLGREESVAAQIRAGIAAYRRHFGRAPRGFWLPECAYRPGGTWARPVGSPQPAIRRGLESILASEGIRYFFVDTHLVSGGVPLGSYDDIVPERRLDASRPSTGVSPNEIHAVAARGTKRRVAVLARDPRSSVQVWSADYGYPGDGAYLEFHRKQGKGGLRYWRITDRRLPLDAKIPYDPEAARARVRAHAEHFAGVARETLREHRAATGRPGVVVAPFDTELFGHWWFEGPQWLEAVLRNLGDDGLPATASECLGEQPPRSVVLLPEGSWGQGGHHWVWLNDDTRWVWELVYRAEDDFLEAVTALRKVRRKDARRVLAQLARELLLLESSDWPFLITTAAARDYAEARARLHFDAFENLVKLARAAGDAPLAKDDETWLSEIESRDGPFPDIDLRWWEA